MATNKVHKNHMQVRLVTAFAQKLPFHSNHFDGFKSKSPCTAVFSFAGVIISPILTVKDEISTTLPFTLIC